jgi:hypothetical protein
VVGQLEAQGDQGGQDPVGEDQLVVGAGASGALAWVAAAGEQGGLVGGGPRLGELGEQLAEVLPGQPGEARIGQGRTGPWWSRHPRMIARAAYLVRAARQHHDPAAIAHQVVRKATGPGDVHPPATSRP